MEPLERTTITYKQEVRSSSLRPPTNSSVDSKGVARSPLHLLASHMPQLCQNCVKTLLVWLHCDRTHSAFGG